MSAEATTNVLLVIFTLVVTAAGASYVARRADNLERARWKRALYARLLLLCDEAVRPLVGGTNKSRDEMRDPLLALEDAWAVVLEIDLAIGGDMSTQAEALWQGTWRVIRTGKGLDPTFRGYDYRHISDTWNAAHFGEYPQWEGFKNAAVNDLQGQLWRWQRDKPER